MAVRSIVGGAVFESFYHQANGDDPSTFEKADSLGMEGYVYFTKIYKEEDPGFLYQARRNHWSLRVDRVLPDYSLVQLKAEISYDFASNGISHTAQAKGYEYDSLGGLTDFKRRIERRLRHPCRRWSRNMPRYAPSGVPSDHGPGPHGAIPANRGSLRRASAGTAKFGLAQHEQKLGCLRPGILPSRVY
ncbi:MAG: hypothetical protein IPG32_04900 [Saprospirales bacterium]|nr:hypothetical protein [Saprospirales bacterium]